MSDNDAGAARILARRFPSVPNLGDLKAIRWQAVLREHGRPDLVTAGFPCFTADTMILTRNGYRAIPDVRVGDLVLTHRRRWRPVTAVMARNAPETVEIRAQGTSRTRCTPEHPWLTEDRDWLPAKELAGQRIVQILPEPEEPGLAPEILWLLGRHLADGYVQDRLDRKSGGRVVICCDPPEADDVLAGARAAGLHGTPARERTVTKVHICRTSFYELARQCGRGAAHKFVPGWLLAGLDQAGAEALLSGYLSGDGCRAEHGTVRAWTSSTVSKALAYSMALVAQRARGVVCSVRLNKMPAVTVIEGRTVNQRPFWKLTVPDRNRSGLVSDDRSIASKYCRTVTAAGPARVYNLAVDEDESYVADNAVVHNCQPFSHAGAQRGTEDRRHLWPYILAGLRVLRPPRVLLENVPGLLGSGLDIVLGGLASLGYEARWKIERACDYGYCHQRARLFIWAELEGRRREPPGRPLAVLKDGFWHQAPHGLLARPMPIRRRIRLAPAGAVIGGYLYEYGSPPWPATPLLLPTVTAGDSRMSRNSTARRAGPGGHAGDTLTDVLVPAWLPTPAASAFNDGESLESWQARNAVLREKGMNGNGMGTPLPIAALSFVPTPRATDGSKGAPCQRGSSGDLMLPSAVMAMLPTPQAHDAAGPKTPAQVAAMRACGHGAVNLNETALSLVPTPTATDGKGASGPEGRVRADGRARGAGDADLPEAIERLSVHNQDVDWGKYTAAVRRQEAITGILAPMPLAPNKAGDLRLAPEFPEWMMAIPAGTVTQSGLVRTAQLRAIGNGVVWPQAAGAALALSAPDYLAEPGESS